MGKLWNDQEKAIMFEYYPTIYVPDLQSLFFPYRTKSAIHRKAQRLNIHKNNYNDYQHARNKLRNTKYNLDRDIVNIDYIRGFVDGEGSFYHKNIIGFNITNKHKHTLDRILDYFIKLHILRKDKKYIDCYDGVYKLSVTTPLDLLYIAEFFSINPLITKKDQFIKWRKELLRRNKKWKE